MAKSKAVPSCAPSPKTKSNVEEGPLSIREVAARTGITTHTLRYYERIGLLHPVPRAGSGHRRYGDADLRWLDFVQKMHATGMPIRTMLEYAKMARSGEWTIAKRRALLEEHRVMMEEKLVQLKSTLTVIQQKIAVYDRAIAEGIEPAKFAAASRRR